MVRVSLKKPRAAIYIRVSTEEQAREGYSLNAQESALKDYVSMMGYDLFKIYKDEGISAKDIKHRPALQQLLKDSEKKLFKAICVYKLDRFSRSLKDLILTIEKLKTLNVDFISLQDKIETASASGKLMFHIISSFAEFERDIISERTKFGMVEKAKEGGIISKAPLGYKIIEGKLFVDPEKKVYVLNIFNEFLNTDKSLNTIAREYHLSVSGLIKVLRNRAYIGEIKFKEVYAGNHEHILEKALFDAAQEKLNKNSYEREHQRYITIIKNLNMNLDEVFMQRLALALSKKEILLRKHSMAELHIAQPSEGDLSDIPEPFKVKKFIAASLLLEDGLSDEEISYNRVFVNADRTDVFGGSSNRKIYVDFDVSNIEKLFDYANEDVEYWLLTGDSLENMYLYKFSRC